MDDIRRKTRIINYIIYARIKLLGVVYLIYVYMIDMAKRK